jgi:hypothetical protein
MYFSAEERGGLPATRLMKKDVTRLGNYSSF